MQVLKPLPLVDETEVLEAAALALELLVDLAFLVKSFSC